MQKVIENFSISLLEFQSIVMPQGAEVLSVSEVDNQILLTALCDPNNGSQTRTVHVVKAGDPINLDKFWKYAGVVVKGGFTWHIFIEG